MKNKYYYLYKITNQLNGKIYIGVHKTNDMNDGYMGSGFHLKSAQKKYGIEYFAKEVLQQFRNEKEMYNEEAVLVDKEFVLREDTYNMKEGGNGKWPSSAAFKGGSKVKKLKIGWFAEEAMEKKRIYSISEKNLQHLLENSKKIASSEEIKIKIKATMKKNKHQQGNKNSQYGKMWITDGEKSKIIKKEEKIPLGWKKGRKIK